MSNTREKIAAASPEKQLASLIQTLDKWLGGVYSALKKKDGELLRLSGEFPELKPLVSMNESLIELLEDQVESLDILKKAKPGMLSSIVDFMYTMVVDPSHQSDKQKYMESLRALKTTPSKRKAPIEEEQDELSGNVEKILKDYKKTPELGEIRLSLQNSFLDSLQWEENPKILEENFGEIYRVLMKYFPKEIQKLANRAAVGLEEFLKRQIEEQEDLSTIEKNKKINNLGQTLDLVKTKYKIGIPQQKASQLFSNFIKIGSNEQQYLKVLEEYQSILESLNKTLRSQTNTYIQQLNQILANLPEGTSKETTFVVKRYRDYIFGLLDPAKSEGLVDQVSRLSSFFRQKFSPYLENEQKSTKQQTKKPEEKTPETKVPQMDIGLKPSDIK